MKVTIDLPEIEGYEYTGEYRDPRDKESYLDGDGCFINSSKRNPLVFRHILRKKRWRAEKGFTYYRVVMNGFGHYFETDADDYSAEHNAFYGSGNYFKIEAEAQAMADKIKQLLKDG